MERQKLAHLLRACSKSRSFPGGLQIHGALLKKGLHSDLILCNDLIDMYCRCGKLRNAGNVFDKMLSRNVVSWTVFMAGHLQAGLIEKSLELFRLMIISGTRPNEFAMSTHLKACGFSGARCIGLMAHGFSVKTGLEENVVVGNSISHMYSRFGLIEEAKKMFEAMPERNLVSWNAMIAGLVLEGDGIGALQLFDEMRSRGEEPPDEFTFSSLLKACSGLSSARSGAQIHAILIVSGYQESKNSILPGALIDLYVRCGRISDAKKVFDRAATKNAVLWTALVAGYSQEGLLQEAMGSLSQIRSSGAQTDEFLLSTLIGIFADFALVNQGKQVHALSVKLPFGSEISVANSILDLYFKCGLPEEATQFFREMPIKNLISWTIFYSKLLQDERIKVQPEHHSCMIDLLGRVGKLEEARDLIQRVETSAGTWQTLLGACRLHKNLNIGREVLAILAKLEGENAANYVMMANMLADEGKWEECEELREMMKKKRMKKQGGSSWI